MTGLTVLTVVVIGLALAAVALVVLLVVSPASGVSLVPGWLTAAGASTTVITGGLVAAVLAGLAVINSRRGRRSGLLVLLAVATVLVTAATHRITDDHGDRGDREPATENTCVVYSGGSQSCPGG
ncbi:hypothetical protein ADL15_19755 [Actinoplanes awajinensis subsp. mycoplanecinus]|uniref:Uncharacterized protein n=1 Tax=Actinoplanes awajinensis subsp. mycoplanecinus TaxID=135947 RepID=A0A101JTH0_9ACTN|nr:hypothetical protein ADL15_19755 [Actinoplanes awajinensis subsp. mycoplanecinus]